jgi:hypothetical protein
MRENIVNSYAFFFFLFLVLLGAYLLFVVLPNNERIQQAEDLVVSDKTCSFNDTVTMVKYNYGSFWGNLGAPSSTTVMLLHGVNQTIGVNPSIENGTSINRIFSLSFSSGWILEPQLLTNFTFPGNLPIIIGKEYTISYEVVTHADNETDLNPLSINLSVTGDTK